MKELIDDGQTIIDHLRKSDFELSAAFWAKFPDIDRWRFYLVSPLVNADDPRGANARLHEAISHLSDPLYVDRGGIRLIASTEPMAAKVLEKQRANPLLRIGPPNWNGGVLGNRYVEGLYVYHLPVTATV